jgi:hypothetical protein
MPLERIAEMAATMTRHWIEQSTNQAARPTEVEVVPIQRGRVCTG